MIKLISLDSGAFPQEAYLLTKPITNIGNLSFSDIRLDLGTKESFQIAISATNHLVRLVNLSAQPIYVNNAPVDDTYYLKNDDQLGLGNRTFLVKLPLLSTEARSKTEIQGQSPREPMPVTPFLFNKTEAQSYPIDKDLITIGKLKVNDISIRDKYVSSIHCQIKKIRDFYYLCDLNSRNGTYLNNIRINSSALAPLSRIQIGETVFLFNHSKGYLDEIHKELNDQGKAICVSPKMNAIYERLKRISRSNISILIQGESGVGKEIFAQLISKLSGKEKYVTVNCGSLSPNLIESELFGHEKGAYSGAIRSRIGLFEEAHGGILFLDEIGELPLEVQSKLLRAIENQEIKRVGDNLLRKVTVRIIAASNRNLKEEVQKGRFRHDLLYRLEQFVLHIPPLREHPEDIPTLVDRFLNHYALEYQEGLKVISKKGVKKMAAFQWPGNIRELKNFIHRLVLENKGKFIADDAIVQSLQEIGADPEKQVSYSVNGGGRALSDMEKEIIGSELQLNNWNKMLTSRLLGISRVTLNAKIKKFGILR